MTLWGNQPRPSAGSDGHHDCSQVGQAQSAVPADGEPARLSAVPGAARHAPRHHVSADHEEDLNGPPVVFERTDPRFRQRPRRKRPVQYDVVPSDQTCGDGAEGID